MKLITPIIALAALVTVSAYGTTPTTNFRLVTLGGAYSIETGTTTTKIVTKPLTLTSIAKAANVDPKNYVIAFDVTDLGVKLVPKKTSTGSPILLFTVNEGTQLVDSATDTVISEDTATGGAVGVFNSHLSGVIGGQAKIKSVGGTPALSHGGGAFFGTSEDPANSNTAAIVHFTFSTGGSFFQK